MAVRKIIMVSTETTDTDYQITRSENDIVIDKWFRGTNERIMMDYLDLIQAIRELFPTSKILLKDVDGGTGDAVE